MKQRNSLYLLSLAVAVSLVAVPAMAQDAKDKDDQAKVTGSVTVGSQAGNGINDSSKLQQYETVPTGVFLEDAKLNWASGSKFMTFAGKKLGLDDQDAWFTAGSKGAWTVKASLNQNQRWFSNMAETLYSQPTPGTFVLPDGMRQALQKIWYPCTSATTCSPVETAAPANSNDNRFWSVRDYVNASQPVDLRYVRRTADTGLTLDAIQNWVFKADYQREMRDGSQPVAFTAGPGIDEVANPIQYTTQNTRFEAEYAKSKLFLNAAMSFNTFDNAVPYTTVDNPVIYSNTNYWWTANPVNATSTNAQARLWNAPSNKATSFDVTGGYSFAAGHKLTLTYSDIVMKNDYTFIAQATNPNLMTSTASAFTLAPEYSQFNGKLNQSLFMANFTGNPSSMFGYSLFYRSFDLTDKAPSYTFHSTVNSDGGASYSATGTTTDDAGFKTGQFKGEVHFMPMTGWKLGFNGSRVKATYADRQFEDVVEKNYGVTIDGNLNFGMLHAAYNKATREPGPINPEFPTAGTTGGPLDVNAGWKDINKQDSKIYSVTFTLTPMDNSSVVLFTSGMNNSYPGTSIGLSLYKVVNYGVDFVYALGDKVTFNAGYIYEKINQDNNFWYGANGNASAPAASNYIDQYWAPINDKIDTYRVGLHFTVTPKSELGTDYDYSKGKSDVNFLVNPGGQAGGDLLFPTNTTTVNFTQMQYLSMPQVYNATTIWKTYYHYHLDKNITLSLLYWRQKFDQADYAYDGIAPYMLNGSALYATTPNAVAGLYPQLDASANRALFLNAVVPNYTANMFRASLTVKF